VDPRSAGEDAGRAALGAALRACEGFEFRSFLCGTRPPPGLPAADADAFRRAANRALGIALEAEWRGARAVDFTRPEAHLTARFPEGIVELAVAPLSVFGRYRKHSRALAQTPFHCPECRGRGGRGRCAKCGGTGRLVPGSVSEFLVPLLVEAAGAEDGIFQGCGREDADVRMLGRGRPFVVSLRGPRRRSLDLEAVRARADAGAAGAADFPVLFAVSPEEAGRVPGTHPPKRYRARVRVEGGATEADAARLAEALRGTVLAQRTPQRVARRRADLVRERRVLDAAAWALDGGALELEVRTEGGTYVKEMISGDEGRTAPSAASILGRPCVCVELDVLDVELPDPPP
jgi:tRNA pseudouridine synthase 10